MEVKNYSSVILVTKSRKVFVSKRINPKKSMYNYWQNPGGHIEQGETPEQCAIREVHEETGIVINPAKLLKIGYETHNKNGAGFQNCIRNVTIYKYELSEIEIPTDLLEPEDFNEWKEISIKRLLFLTPKINTLQFYCKYRIKKIFRQLISRK